MRFLQRQKLRGWMVIVMVFFSLGFVTRTVDDYFEISKSMEIFSAVYKDINNVYVDETNPTQLMRTAIDAMLGSLDPYTNYYSESQIDYSKLMSTGHYSGIGADIGTRDGKTILMELYENGPADEAGLKVGDEIIRIDEETISGRGLSMDEINSLLLGEKGSAVVLTIFRAVDNTEKSISLLRGGTEIQSENVPYSGMATEDIGYILLSGFMQDAGSEVAEATQKLKKSNPGLKGIILDLRGNPGGRLDEAVNVTNVFVPQNEKIVEMKGRTPDSQNSFSTRMPAIDPDIPVAVLINGRSASASEIVSGAIQDLDRGVIVGQKSFGKGLVQNVRPLSYNTQMKITIAKYYTPSGRCIQAIDYSEHRQDGTADRIADSLRVTFKTRNGRMVYDGAGVDPEIVVEKPATQPVIQALEEQRTIFDFSTWFTLKHDTIAPPQKFEITDEIFESFVAFVAEKKFTFKTETEAELQKLDEILHKEQYRPDLEGELKTITHTLTSLKQTDIRTHKAEISRLLKKELINRYFYKQGVLEASFKDDPDILTAVEVLKDSLRYQKILNPGQ
ncbi:MAG: S41 family peptidase [Bacteroidia bacterium]|nr:S41 family peptidase [Bacteroidia bacterium]